MAISLDELFSDKVSAAVVATAVAAAAAAAAEEKAKAVPAPEAPKEGEKKEAKEAAAKEKSGDGKKDEPKEEVIELRVPICCEGCVEKMERKLILMEGEAIALHLLVRNVEIAIERQTKPNECDIAFLASCFGDGVVAVECDVAMQKVSIRGTAKAEAVLKNAKKIQRRTELWN